MEQKKYGFVPSEITSDQYILGGGGLPKIIINPSRNWKEWLPKWESQVDKFDTYGCTVFGTLNAVETILNKLDGVDVQYDFSERYNYILANVAPPGADPHYVSEILRKYGVIEQALLPFTDSLEQFNKPKPMEVMYLSKGQDWLQKYSFGHEWVFTSYPGKQNMINAIRETLQYSPVCVSVTAWYEQDGVYVDNGLPNTHWCMCYGIDEDGGLLIYDSYALVQDGVATNSFKKLHPDHKVLMAKRYHLEAKKYEEKLSWIGGILKTLAEYLGIIKKQVEALPKTVDKPIVVTPEQPIIKNMLNDFCLAIRDYEGKPGDLNYRNNNPFNLKFIGQKGAINSNGFAKFPTYADGWKAGVQMITNACTGKSKIYKPEMTIPEFFRVYAPSSDNNNPDLYAKYVCKRIGVSLDFKIKNLIS